MRVAAATNDSETISHNFGRTIKYSVLKVDEGKIVSSEILEITGHREFQQNGLKDRPRNDVDPIIKYISDLR